MRKFVKVLIVIIILLGVGVWFGIPALLGTGFAHDKIQKAMAQGTGREVALGDISFGWASGLTVSDVVVKQKAGDFTEEGPLFTLKALSLDVGWKQILDQKIEVNDLTIDAPSIVIIRDKDGRFNFDDLLEKTAGEPAPAPAPTGKAPPVTVNLFINGGRVIFIDQKAGTRVEMKDIDAKAEWREGVLAIDSDFDLNGGGVKLLANADLSKKPSPFEVKEFVIDGSTFSTNGVHLASFIPLMGDKPQEASGTLGFRIEGLKADGLDMESMKRSLTGSGNLSLAAGTLASGPVTQIYSALRAIGARDLSALAAAGGGSEALTFDLLKSTFAIHDGRIFTDDLSVKGAGLNLNIAGSTGLDGTLDYTMTAAGLDELIAKNENLKKYLGDSGSLPFGFKGSLSSPKISIDAEGAMKNAAERLIEDQLGDKIPAGLKDLIPGGK